MLRIVFMGTPDFAVPTLSEVIGAGHEVCAVYTQPPRPAGRGMEETRSPVHRFAVAAGIEVRTPRTLRDTQVQQAFTELAADVAVVVAYGLILPRTVLDAPRHGCLNLHGSRLPRWRGAAPIQRALMAGDRATAVMVMRMEEGLDTGPICLAETLSIDPQTTAGQLHDTMKDVGAGLMVRALAALRRDALVCTPQPVEGVTYAAKIEKSETRIDFSRTADAVHNHIRGLSPFPGAWFELEVQGRRERIKVLRSQQVEAPAGAVEAGVVLDDALRVACGQGSVRLLELQRAGRKPMPAAEILRGLPITSGQRLDGNGTQAER